MALLAGLLAWLWPFGVGGRMPVGGDVTQFSIGLMAVLHRAIRQGRLPLWNDLWGYGFPGVAESQMGAFYPPHLVLYGLLPLEAAYTASLVLHTLWAGLGAAWAARRFGASAWAATLGGWAFATCGFFVIHFPHQWGYTVGSWMPWAWGLAWTLARGEGGRRTSLTLAAVLAIQVLPGHFQLAFETQVGVLALAVWGLVERPSGMRRAALGAGMIVLGLILAAPLAAMQLWPTWRLARLAESRRDYEYLSGFAIAPLHLIGLVAPGLFHRAYSWRPWVWDPLRTSPEELLLYVGLAPLLLALGTIGRDLRRERAVRALLLLTLLTLWLGLGPNAAGFSTLIRLPGFSFFRAPARWGLAVSLGLSLLAARGFDGLRDWRRPGRAIGLFVMIATLAIASIVLGVEFGIPLDKPSNRLAVWPSGVRFGEIRWKTYTAELGTTAAGLAALLVLVPLSRRRGWLRSALLILTFVDLWLLGRIRPVMDAPIRPLIEQSPVLARLARGPRGTRVHLADKSNLAQVAGLDEVSSYRTLDLPVAEGLTAMIGLGNPRDDGRARDAMRLTGTSALVLDPVEAPMFSRPRSRRPFPRGPVETIDDPALTSWYYAQPWWIDPRGGSMLRPTPVPPRFVIWSPIAEPALAWLLSRPAGDAVVRAGPSSPDPLGDFLRVARPIRANRPRPERVEIAVHADGPAFVVISQLDYPEWRAWWDGPGGRRPATIDRVFGREGAGAWQGVAVPGPGDWALHLEFRGRDVRAGLIVSALAWTLFLVAFFWPARRLG